MEIAVINRIETVSGSNGIKYIQYSITWSIGEKDTKLAEYRVTAYQYHCVFHILVTLLQFQ